MPKLPGVNHLDVVRALQKVGFWVSRQGKHIVMTDGNKDSDHPPTQPGQRDHYGQYRPRRGTDRRSVSETDVNVNVIRRLKGYPTTSMRCTPVKPSASLVTRYAVCSMPHSRKRDDRASSRLVTTIWTSVSLKMKESALRKFTESR